MSTHADLDDGFDDVSIDNVAELNASEKHYPAHSSLNYLYRKNRSIQCVNSADSFFNYRSTQSLIDNHSHDQINKQSVPKSSPEKMENSKPEPRLSYSPSKKLKAHRNLKKEDLEDFGSIGNSDDELDDSTIIFDVPLSQSLSQLTNRQKPIPPKLLSLTSESTRQSSLMSYSHYSCDQDSESYDADILTRDAKRLTYEFTQNKVVLAVQESQMRRDAIEKFDRTKSLDGDLPHSKLKEKFVSTTRPSYLPPKDKKEAIEHLRQMKEFKSQAIRNELKLERAKLKEIKDRNRALSKDAVTWEKEIMPNFQQKIQQSSTRELWWRGVPPKFRKNVWSRVVENRFLDSNTLRSIKMKSVKIIKENDDIVKQIREDISRTFPDLGVFQNEYFEDLQLVLVMVSQYKKYDRGIHTLAAVIYYNVLDVDKTMLILTGLLQRHLMKILYNDEKHEFQEESQSFLRTFARLNPRLYEHFHTVQKINPRDYLFPLLKPVFSSLLNIEICSLIIDVYIFEGDSALWRCVLGLFEQIGYKLYGNKKEILGVIGWDALTELNKDNGDSWWRYLDVGDEYEFMNTVRQVLKKQPV